MVLDYVLKSYFQAKKHHSRNSINTTVSRELANMLITYPHFWRNVMLACSPTIISALVLPLKFPEILGHHLAYLGCSLTPSGLFFFRQWVLWHVCASTCMFRSWLLVTASRAQRKESSESWVAICRLCVLALVFLQGCPSKYLQRAQHLVSRSDEVRLVWQIRAHRHGLSI